MARHARLKLRGEFTIDIGYRDGQLCVRMNAPALNIILGMVVILVLGGCAAATSTTSPPAIPHDQAPTTINVGLINTNGPYLTYQWQFQTNGVKLTTATNTNAN